MKNIAINIKKGKGQRKKAVKVLRLNGYKVVKRSKSIHSAVDRVYLVPGELSKFWYTYGAVYNVVLTLKKQGGGDWMRLYELIKKDKGSVKYLPCHADLWWQPINKALSYPQYGKDVNPETKPSNDLPELGDVDGDLVTKPEWDYPCCGKTKTGTIVLFESLNIGVVVFVGKDSDHYLNYKSKKWFMPAFTPTNIKEDN